jgi:diketogulonate reductase-like aldo/keto reductase
MGAFYQTLNDLRLDYLDLYLMHWPIAFKSGDDPFPTDTNGNIIIEDIDFCDTWHAMEKLLETGKVKVIGVSNFSIQHLERLLKTTRIIPAVNQIEMHPYYPQEKLRNYCKEKDIHITAYRSFGHADEPKLWNDPTVIKSIIHRFIRS